jgi:hypothetical protein
MIFNRVKKSFTLIELIIVIILISISYYLVFSSSNFKLNNDYKKISFPKIKEYLMKNFEFENKISLVCIDENLVCYIKIDDKINPELKIENLFKTKPDVYEYTKEQELVSFNSIDINNITQDVFFKFEINSDYKSKDVIVDTLEEKIYLFNSLFKEAKVFNSLDELFETFNLNKVEVQDAF